MGKRTLKPLIELDMENYVAKLGYIDQFFKYTPKEDAMLWLAIRHQRGELFLVRTDLALKGKADVSLDVSLKEAAEFADRLLI